MGYWNLDIRNRCGLQEILVLLGNGTFDFNISAKVILLGFIGSDNGTIREFYRAINLIQSIYWAESTVFSYAIGSSFVVTNSLVKGDFRAKIFP